MIHDALAVSGRYPTMNAIVDEVFAPWAMRQLPGWSTLKLAADPGNPYRWWIVMTNWSPTCAIAALPIHHRIVSSADARRIAEYLETRTEELVQLMHFTLVYQRGGYC